MSFLRNLDFWNAMILVGLLGSAALGAWNFLLRGQLERAEKAYESQKKTFVDVHAECEQIAQLRQAEKETNTFDVDARGYFQGPLSNQRNGGDIPATEYHINPDRPKQTTFRTKGRRRKAQETTVTIDFKQAQGRNRRPYPRPNVFRALFYAEAESKRWKLRELHLRSKEDMGGRRTGASYPLPMSDEWFVEKMIFVSREPIR